MSTSVKPVLDEGAAGQHDSGLPSLMFGITTLETVAMFPGNRGRKCEHLGEEPGLDEGAAGQHDSGEAGARAHALVVLREGHDIAIADQLQARRACRSLADIVPVRQLCVPVRGVLSTEGLRHPPYGTHMCHDPVLPLYTSVKESTLEQLKQSALPAFDMLQIQRCPLLLACKRPVKTHSCKARHFASMKIVIC